MFYLLFFIFSFILTYLIKNYAIKKSLVASVNERSSHTVPTPHGGGIAIAITWFIALFYLRLTLQIDEVLFNALLVGFIISIVSFLDDLYELSAKLRFMIQALVAILSLYFLGGFNSLDLGFFTIDNQIITNIFAFFMIIWFINLYNFLDGINGYAGSEAVFLSFSGFLLFGGSHFIVLAFAVLGFLFWNYNRAKIFMGDVGSTLLGFNIAIFAIYYSNQDSSNFWIWITLFSLYWFDATYTLIRRKLNKEKISQAHKKHAYQRLTQANWSHFKVTNYSIIINLIILGFVYFIHNIYVAFLLSLILLFSIMQFINGKKAFS
ncbi:glycosyl transferase [Halarcobacter ebronensis]|uniref:Glycosyl transferase n=1 Tax=Halarcobacter ebronensis TaxID=1462615 RepID=A0A4Q0YEV7_9BACT|nr:glycosyltransferase family 4 protein [Halarcobacter ebronensis]RXJ69012.1 glycosyl transferase [Halarcobacter ebronensis]